MKYRHLNRKAGGSIHRGTAQPFDKGTGDTKGHRASQCKLRMI